jgi:hypothetical protein
MAAGQGLVDGGPPDEPGAAENQQSHPASLPDPGPAGKAGPP